MPYRRKIKTAAEITKAIGERPRKRKVILCHGVFDVVHPGHLRHLIYAKGKASILVASVTADRFITKGAHRPHVPQDLRALNLAALEMVDYVLIDDHPTPLETIRLLKPDYFAKGYEYSAKAEGSRTDEEAAALAEYGAEIIFTPGDVVYSSSKLIEAEAPNLRVEKLLTVMEAEGISFDALRHGVQGIGRLLVHVIGDTIVDSLTDCAVIGGQTKTPTLSVAIQGRRNYVGGAAIVAKHLSAAGAWVRFTTVLGDDELGKFVQDDLHAAEIAVSAHIDRARPTTHKNAIVADQHRLLKLDTVDNRTISDEALTDLIESARVSTQALIFADFRHGIFNRRTIPHLIEAIPEGAFRVADSQVASRWGNILDFPDFDLITPNEREARLALGDQDSGIRALATELHAKSRAKSLLLKLGERGSVLCYGSPEQFVAIDSFADAVVDPVGAGDAMLAYATLGSLVSRNPVIAAILGTFAAALECEKDGNIPIKAEDVLAKIDAVEKQARYEK